MLKNWKLVLVLFVFVLSMVPIASATNIYKPTIIKENINVACNETFQIKLRANPTIEQRWFMISDPEYLTLVNRTYVPDIINIVGGGWTEVVTFKAIKQGETTLKFKKQILWDPRYVTSIREYQITIT